MTLFSVSLVKYHSTNEAGTENKNGASHSEEETMEQILQQEKTAAGILCQLNSQHASQASNLAFAKDVLGIVANLARVDDDNLSRSVFLILQIFLQGIQLLKTVGLIQLKISQTICFECLFFFLFFFF